VLLLPHTKFSTFESTKFSTRHHGHRRSVHTKLTTLCRRATLRSFCAGVALVAFQMHKALSLVVLCASAFEARAQSPTYPITTGCHPNPAEVRMCGSKLPFGWHSSCLHQQIFHSAQNFMFGLAYASHHACVYNVLVFTGVLRVCRWTSC
jgi:hypothetical protein